MNKAQAIKKLEIAVDKVIDVQADYNLPTDGECLYNISTILEKLNHLITVIENH